MKLESGLTCYYAHFWIDTLTWCELVFRTTHRKWMQVAKTDYLCSAFLLAFRSSLLLLDMPASHACLAMQLTGAQLSFVSSSRRVLSSWSFFFFRPARLLFHFPTIGGTAPQHFCKIFVSVRVLSKEERSGLPPSPKFPYTKAAVQAAVP